MTTLPAPAANIASNLTDLARRHTRYIVDVEANGAQELSGVFVWARAAGKVFRLLGQPNGGQPITLAAGLGATFDLTGGDWDGLYLQATPSTAAAMTVTVTPLIEEG